MVPKCLGALGFSSLRSWYYKDLHMYITLHNSESMDLLTCLKLSTCLNTLVGQVRVHITLQDQPLFAECSPLWWRAYVYRGFILKLANFGDQILRIMEADLSLGSTVYLLGLFPNTTENKLDRKPSSHWIMGAQYVIILTSKYSMVPHVNKQVQMIWDVSVLEKLLYWAKYAFIEWYSLSGSSEWNSFIY